MDKAELAIRGAANAQIDKTQVRRLILAAASAFRVQAELGLADGDFDTWRRGVLWDLCGKASFRALGQREFGRALAEFMRLGGSAGSRGGAGARRGWNGKNAAIASNETGPEGDRRRAEWKLREACREFAEAFGGEARAEIYADNLLRRIHGVRADPSPFPNATAKQLWSVYFTLRSRGAAKLKKAAAETAPGSPVAGGSTGHCLRAGGGVGAV
ncbi:MAG TPA: hypothetical protein PLG22_07235 [Kiritimatiellia bacterium]|nr:hypothetical protein [Kiritimatiellia bacterium]